MSNVNDSITSLMRRNFELKETLCEILNVIKKSRVPNGPHIPPEDAYDGDLGEMRKIAQENWL